MGSWICSGRNRFDKFVGQINLTFSRNFAVLSMEKDPELELALSWNKRWIVNHEIKNIILQCPSEDVTVEWIQNRYFDPLGSAKSWLKKYPCCYDVYLKDDKYCCRLTKRMMSLVEEEEAVKEMQESVFADRLAKLLMMSCDHRLNVQKLNALQSDFGFPDDYILRIVPKYPDMFKIVNYTGRRSSMEIVLASWCPDLAVSSIEKVAQREGRDPCFPCKLPSNMVESWEMFEELNSTPYISPYTSPERFLEGATGSDKRTVSIVHELLSLTLWRKAPFFKLGSFRKEFGLSDKLDVCLLKYPGIFYVSNRYRIYTVLLREAYNGSVLIDKDPLVIVNEKFGELMQEGLHEYNRRRCLLNIEKRRQKGLVFIRPPEKKIDQTNDDSVEEDDEGGDLGGILDPEERKRFYKVIFEHDGS